MVSAKFLLAYSVLAAGAWGASIGPDRWQILLQVACALVMSLTIFMAILSGAEKELAIQERSPIARNRPDCKL